MDPVEFRPIDRSQHELLIVDDDPASRYATVRLLQNAGFRTRDASTGAQALLAADASISAVVLDVHLPDIDGFEVCRMLRSRTGTSRLPVLHLTAAYVTDQDKVRGLDSGADAYLTHPVEPAVLVATVQALVRTRAAEEAMHRSEAKFRATYAHAPVGIGLLDEDGRFLDANPALLALLQRDLAAIAGQRVSEFCAADAVARVDAATRQVGAVASRLEFTLIGPSGQAVPVEWTLTPHIEPNVHMAIVSDISQRLLLAQQRQSLLDGERSARNAAEKMNRVKDNLIAVLSHELRTPLNAIMNWTHVLQTHLGPDQLARGLQAIERNGRMQARMISDILDMSRLNIGKLPLRLDPVDPAEMVRSAAEAVQASLQDGGQRLVLDLAPAYRSIRADGSRIQQVVWNLLSNSIKFSPPGTEIRVSLREDDHGVHLAVSDQGLGVAAEFLPHLFESFTQSDAPSNRKRGGLGLGLSIVKQLVEAHGGTVTADSAGAGHGMRVEVWLPAEPELHDARQPGTESLLGELPAGEAQESALEGLSLLVVDDDAEAGAMLRIILGDRGAAVAVADDYASALKALDVLRPDVLISDVGMPGKDGYDLVREIRRREGGGGDHLPCIALTSFARAQDREQALAAGFDEHCAKPLRPLQLVQLIQRLLAAPPGQPG